MLTAIGWSRGRVGVAGRASTGARSLVRRAGLVALGLLALIGVVAQEASAAAPWSDQTTLLQGRYDHTATLLDNGKVLVMGGASTTFVAAPELYDPAAKSWTATGGLSSSSARQRHTATLLPNGKVLVAGGYTSGGTTATTRIYDPATNVWSVGPNMVWARYSHTATLLPSGKVLVVGGYYSTGPTTAAELYDPATNAWTSVASQRVARYAHTSTLLPNGKVLVTGGTDGAGAASASAEVYDPAGNSWSDTPAMPAARSNQTATLLGNGTVLVAGGLSMAAAGANPVTLATASVFNPVMNSWSAAPSMGAARYRHSATLLPTGKVLVVGGFNVSPSIHRGAELYDSVSGSWSSAGSTTTARVRHTATLLHDGQVLVAGGYTGTAIGAPDSFITSAERFVATVPDAPTGVSAAAGDRSATVEWTAPASDGGLPVTSYVVTSSPGNASAILTAPATKATITGLTNGTAYDFTVVTRNAQGDGVASAASNAVIPAPTLSTIAVTPADTSVERGTSRQLSASGTYSDDSSADVTATATWSSSDADVATVDSSGRVDAVAVGSATVSATRDGVVGSTRVNVTKAAAELALSDLVQTYDGTPKRVAVTTTPRDLDGVTVSYDGSPTPPTNAGRYAVVASLTNSQHAAPDADGELVIEQADNRLTFDPLEDRRFDDPDFELAASVSSRLKVAFAADGACTVDGATVHLTGAGSCTITASQDGNNDYKPADHVSHTFTIHRPPQWTVVPDDITREATGPDGATASWPPLQALDTRGALVAVNCSLESGATFPLATTTVTCTAREAAGSESSTSFHVTVHDTTGPTIKVPEDISAEATGPTGAPITWRDVSATDLVDGAIDPTCDAGPGTFALGTHTITCSASDTHENTISTSFTIRVADTTAPVITVPEDISAEATGPTGAPITWRAVSATDLVDGAIDPTCDAGPGTFALGTHKITCSASDTHENTISTSFTIRVADTTAPVITVPEDITAEATGPTGAPITWRAVSATDLVDGAIDPTCDAGPGTFALGTHKVTCAATDTHGNEASTSFHVTVRDTAPPSPAPLSPAPPSPTLPSPVDEGTAIGTLRGAVTAGGKLQLHFKGAPAKRLAPGRYLIIVKDQSRRLNFDLRGPGLKKTTGRAAKRGTFRWSVRLAPGRYRFGTDAGRAAGGSFRVK